MHGTWCRAKTAQHKQGLGGRAGVTGGAGRTVERWQRWMTKWGRQGRKFGTVYSWGKGRHSAKARWHKKTVRLQEAALHGQDGALQVGIAWA